MTLVLQTTNETEPSGNAAIREVIERHGLVAQDTSVAFGVDTFSYYRLGSHQDAKAIIEDLMKLPGVAAAYVKHGGSPPM